MSDFFQNGVIITFHRLGKFNKERIEKELSDFSQEMPIALVLPSLYREFLSGALPKIMNKLRGANYIKQIVLSLDGANADQFKKVKKAFYPFFGKNIRVSSFSGLYGQFSLCFSRRDIVEKGFSYGHADTQRLGTGSGDPGRGLQKYGYEENMPSRYR
jgi:hypothetical protein